MLVQAVVVQVTDEKENSHREGLWVKTVLKWKDYRFRRSLKKLKNPNKKIVNMLIT